jgi:hypothetical protein
VRRIAGIGRYGEWERNIQLEGGRYISLGTDNKIEFNKAVRFVTSVLPDSPENGIKKQDLLDKRAREEENISARTLDRALAWLVKQGDVGEQQLMNQRGKPKVYWRASKPPGDSVGISTDPQHTHSEFGENKHDGSSEATELCSRQTPSYINDDGAYKSSDVNDDRGASSSHESETFGRKNISEGEGVVAELQPDTNFPSVAARSAPRRGVSQTTGCR